MQTKSPESLESKESPKLLESMESVESIDNKCIRDILDKYFEAFTTLEEEQKLRDYFAGEVASEFTIYKPLFDAFSNERQAMINGIENTLLIENDSSINDSSINDTPIKKIYFKRKSLKFRWLISVVAAAVIVFMLTLLPGKRDSLQLIVDGVNVNNNELAISLAESQLSHLNYMLNKYKQSNEQLENLSRVGDAISPLSSMEKFLKQNP